MEHWIDLSPGWLLYYEEAFIESLARTLREEAKMVNIGGGVGTSSVAMLRGTMQLQKVSLLSVDLEECEKERQIVERWGMTDRFRQEIMPSGDLAAHLKEFDVKLDMVFVDGSHEYKSTLEDLKSYSKLLKPGGLLVCHDYEDPRQKNVTDAVDKWRSLKTYGESWHLIGKVIYTIAFKKPSPDTEWQKGRL